MPCPMYIPLENGWRNYWCHGAAPLPATILHENGDYMRWCRKAASLPVPVWKIKKKGAPWGALGEIRYWDCLRKFVDVRDGCNVPIIPGHIRDDELLTGEPVGQTTGICISRDHREEIALGECNAGEAVLAISS